MISSRYHFSDSQAPVLALAIHNGHELPDSLLPYMGIDEDTRYREEDPHTGSFAELFSNHIIVESSRFAVDLNRPIHRAIYQNPEDAWGLNVRSKALNDTMIQLLRQDYEDWYAVLSYQIERMLSLHPFLMVFDLHSYNHRRAGPFAAPDPQLQNPDIILGRNNMPAAYYPYIETLKAKLDGQNLWGNSLDVRCDVKFPGGHLSRWLHHNYPEKLLCLAVEFKKIFMDEHSGELNPVYIHRLRQSFVDASTAWLAELPAKL